MTWILVTGGSSPIGQAIVTRMTNQGMSVVLQCNRHQSRAVEFASELSARGKEVVVIRQRLDRSGDPLKLVQRCLVDVGPIDHIAHVAATGVMRSAQDVKSKHLSWSASVTAYAFVELIVALRPQSAVAISSTGATQVVPNYLPVAMAKSALATAVRYLAVELAPETRVNGIVAGLVRTPSALLLKKDAGRLLEDAEQATPMKRLVTPSDIADVAAYLLSEQASMINGANIDVDGGLSLRWNREVHAPEPPRSSPPALTT